MTIKAAAPGYGSSVDDVPNSRRQTVRLPICPFDLKLTTLRRGSVRRNEIYSRSPSAESSDLDSDLETRFHQQLSNICRDRNGAELLKAHEPQVEEALISDNDGDNPKEEGYEFHLFSGCVAKPSDLKRPPHVGSQRIVLRSPSPANGDPGFLSSRRGGQHYFTGPTSTEKMEEYRVAAVSGEDIMKGLDVLWVWS